MRPIPLNQQNVVTILSSAYEKAVLEFKKEYDLADLDRDDTRFEIAKDIAAFANSRGGTIVVGAIEDRSTGKLSNFEPVANVALLQKAVEQAYTQFCTPVPIVTIERIDVDVASQRAILKRSVAKPVTIVAINVDPYVAGPIATRVWRGGKKSVFVEGAYRVWQRGVEKTRWLRPEEVAMLVDHQERRMLLRLDEIPRDTVVLLWVPVRYREGETQDLAATIVMVDHVTGTLIVRSGGANEDDQVRCEIPAALIRAVWRDRNSSWNIAVAGTVLGTDRTWDRFVPIIF